MAPRFSYADAFDRNLGWFTEKEQQSLRGKTVAIAGMGGVGGVHLLTLVRLGITKFRIADLDVFEVANFNRQVGALMSSLDRPKVEVLARMAKDINPEVEIVEFPAGVTAQNLDDFLRGADLFIDGFDFFVLDIRRRTFARCRELGIPAMTAAPVGMGVAFLLFTADGMTFEDYFRFEGKSELRQYINFLMGLSPSGMHRSYLVEPARLDIARRKAPSTIIGAQLCASFTAAQTVKFLLGRGPVKPAPFHYHFDSYLNIFKAGPRRGNNGLLQRWKGDAVERALKKQLGSNSAELFPSTAGR
ncbi:MAG TPA: ThiF family adenylyltransferase [Rhizomicrobium sp.]|jgi:molybdopterin/thiamine biosynthesis adenylyltransferase|nr:ThiF family adenylyltransferase [Rhizomicrobium sp.]